MDASKLPLALATVATPHVIVERAMVRSAFPPQLRSLHGNIVRAQFNTHTDREAPLMRVQTWSCRALLGSAILFLSSSLASGAAPSTGFFKCDEPSGILCAEQRENPGGNEYYVGHDEPSLLFYSNTPGAGFNNVYRLSLIHI